MAISPAVRALINEHISSVAQLEMLLLLRMNADRWWAADTLSQELRAESGWLTRVLAELCERGLCEKSAETPAQFR